MGNGGKAKAKVWAFPAGTFEGAVRSIAPSAEQGAYGKVVRVQVELQDPDHQLLPGMTGNAKIAGHWYPAIVVFTRALLRFFFVEVWRSAGRRVGKDWVRSCRSWWLPCI